MIGTLLSFGIYGFTFLIILIYISVFFKTNSLLDKFVTRMPIASQFILALGIFITYLLLRLNFLTTLANISSQTDKDSYIDTLNILDKYKDSCPNLIDSFFFPWQKDGSDDDTFNNHSLNSYKTDNSFSSIIVSNYIFQNLGLYVQTSAVTNNSDSRFLIFYSSFFRSELLKNKWDKFNVNFGKRTFLLGNKLFEINEKYKFESPEEIKIFFDNYVNTDEFKKIMTAEDKTNVTEKISQLL